MKYTCLFYGHLIYCSRILKNVGVLEKECLFIKTQYSDLTDKKLGIAFIFRGFFLKLIPPVLLIQLFID
jgi:hypothetical protein